MKKFLNNIGDKYGCLGLIVVTIILLGLTFGLDCLMVWACMALWNSCLVSAIGVSTVSFWQMFGISLLCHWMIRGIKWNSEKSE